MIESEIYEDFRVNLCPPQNKNEGMYIQFKLAG